MTLFPLLVSVSWSFFLTIFLTGDSVLFTGAAQGFQIKLRMRALEGQAQPEASKTRVLGGVVVEEGFRMIVFGG